MAPFFVVEGEPGAGPRPELEAPPGELGIARDAVAGKSARSRELRRRIAERLARVVEGFGVHVLVPRGEPGKIREFRLGDGPYALDHSAQHLVAVLESARERRQRQRPALVVRHGGRVVQSVGVRQNRFAPRAPQAPEFLKPSYMTQLPARWVDGRQLRAELARPAEIIRDATGMRPG